MNALRTASTLLLAGLALMFVGVSAQAETLDDIRKAKNIRIAIDLAIPPFGMTDDKMQPTGSDVDLARLLAKDLGVELEIVTTTGATRIPLLQTNKVDLVISTLSITPDRAKVIDFSLPYADHLSVVAALKPIQIKELSDLDGKKVAVVRGTTQDSDLTQKAKGAQLVRYEDDATMALAAASLQTFHLAVGLRKNETKLLEWVNGWVKANLRNGKLNDIYKNYHGVGVAADILKAGD